jgi:hypothetical protein
MLEIRLKLSLMQRLMLISRPLLLKKDYVLKKWLIIGVRPLKKQKIEYDRLKKI